MTLTDILVASLTGYLQRAQKAHHAYELEQRTKRGDPTWTDEAWDRWYAEFIVEKLTTIVQLDNMAESMLKGIDQAAAKVCAARSEAGYGHGV